jgi:hypothetical protein
MVDEATIAEAGRRIGAAAPEGSRVILFGSHARGEANSHSDVDILVIGPEVENATERVGPPLSNPERSENPDRRPRPGGEQRSKERSSSEPSERDETLSPRTTRTVRNLRGYLSAYSAGF